MLARGSGTVLKISFSPRFSAVNPAGGIRFNGFSL